MRVQTIRLPILYRLLFLYLFLSIAFYHQSIVVW